MTYRCAGCGAWLQPHVAHCAACHRAVGAAESGKGSAADKGLELDYPDQMRAPAPMPVRAEPDPFDEVFGVAPESELELDVVAPRRSAPHRPSGKGQPMPGQVDPPEGDGRPEPPVPHMEAMAVSGYGTPPHGFFSAVPYGIQVWIRRRELRGELREVERVKAASEVAAQCALADLGRDLVARSGEIDLGELGPFLDRARSLLGATKPREGDVIDSQPPPSRIDALRADLERLEREVAPYRDQETKLTTQLSVRVADVGRARVQLHRAEIELRNEPRVGADAARIQILDADKVARQAELTRAQAKVDELTQRMATVKRELAARLDQIARIEGALGDAQEAVSLPATARDARTDLASDEATLAAVQLADRARQAGLDQQLGPVSHRAEVALSAFWKRCHDVRVYTAALDAYHHPTVKRALILFGGAGLLIVAMVIMAIVGMFK